MNNLHTTMNPGYHGHGSSGMPPRSGERYPGAMTSGSATSANQNTHTVSEHKNVKNHSSDDSSQPSVGFSRQTKKEDQYQDDRKKYLTAKYPQHQMRLIRKRLQVEDWLDNQLRELYNAVDDTDSYDCEIDLDDLLDLDETSERRAFVMEQLTSVPKPREVINRFVDELLEKASTL